MTSIGRRWRDAVQLMTHHAHSRTTGSSMRLDELKWRADDYWRDAHIATDRMKNRNLPVHRRRRRMYRLRRCQGHEIQYRDNIEPIVAQALLIELLHEVNDAPAATS